MEENTTALFRESVKEQAEQQADTARQELGEIVIDATDRYFPEAVQQRRRRDMAAGFVLGVFVGGLLGGAVGQR